MAAFAVCVNVHIGVLSVKSSVLLGTLLSFVALTSSAQALTPVAVITDGTKSIVGSSVMTAVTESQLCEFAQKKPAGDDIRAFCRNATPDDQRVGAAGLQFAQRNGIAGVTLAPLPGTSGEIDSLGRYDGRDFDRQWLLVEIGNGLEIERELRFSLEFGGDPTVRRFDNSAFAIFARHLEAAETLLRGESESPN